MMKRDGERHPEGFLLKFPAPVPGPEGEKWSAAATWVAVSGCMTARDGGCDLVIGKAHLHHLRSEGP